LKGKPGDGSFASIAEVVTRTVPLTTQEPVPMLHIERLTGAVLRLHCFFILQGKNY